MNETPDHSPPPPMRNWARCDAGLPGQPSLPGLEDGPAPAERVFLQLARRWREGFADVVPDHAPPRAVDELALAAVLLAREHGAVFTEVAWQQAQANIALAETRSVSWMDRLPWRLATAARMPDPGRGGACEELICCLDHHTSALRIWTMELAWMVRPWLERETALPRLLKNVADTLAGVEIAWGLAGELFAARDEFHAAAEDWQPEEFAEQHAERVTSLKDQGLTATQASFWKTESACRRLIAETAISV